jgi:hypothetical protein
MLELLLLLQSTSLSFEVYVEVLLRQQGVCVVDDGELPSTYVWICLQLGDSHD